MDLTAIINELNYELDYEKRVDIIKLIERKYGQDLLNYYWYYKNSNLKDYNNRITFDNICKTYDQLSEYILFSDGVERNEEYPYSPESNSQSISAENEVSLEKYMKQLSKDEKIGSMKHYDDQNHAKYKIADFKKDVDRFPTVKEYLTGDMIYRAIIEEYECKLKQYNRILEKLKKNNQTDRIEKVKRMWEKIYNSKYDTNGVYLNKLTYGEYIEILKRAVGYTKNNSKEIDKDIITVYKDLAGLIYFKSPLKSFEKSTRRCEYLDFFDIEHVQAIFRGMSLRGHSAKFDKILNKMDWIISMLDLTDFEKQIIDVYKTGMGIDINYDVEIEKRVDLRKDFTDNIMTFTECARRLQTSKQNIEQSFRSLCREISEAYVKWYEWNIYYLDLARGTYKQCSKCGEIKLANERYFYKEPKGKDGFKNICIKCYDY